MTSLSLQDRETLEGAATELPFDPIWFGVITLVLFLAMLALLWSFRNTLTLDPVDHHGTHGDPDSSPDTGRSGRV